MEFIPSKYNYLVEEHIFGNPRIVDSNGYPYKPLKDLIRLGIFKVRDLSFKSGTKKFNKKVFNAVREIRKHIPSQSNLPNTGSENPLKCRLKICKLIWVILIPYHYPRILYYLYMIQGHSCTTIVELVPRIDQEVHRL